MQKWITCDESRVYKWQFVTKLFLHAAHILTSQDQDNIKLKGQVTNYEDVGIPRCGIFTTSDRFCFNKLFELKKLLLHAPRTRVSIHCHLLDASAIHIHHPPIRYDSRLKYDAIRFIACGTILQVTIWNSAWLYDAHLSWCRANQCVHLLIKIKLNRPLSTVHIYFYIRLA